MAKTPPPDDDGLFDKDEFIDPKAVARKAQERQDRLDELNKFRYVPPSVVHDFAAKQLAAIIGDGQLDRVDQRHGIVVHYHGEAHKTIIRVRDTQKLDPDLADKFGRRGNPERKYEVTIREFTAKGNESPEWRAFFHREYDLYGYCWADVTGGRLKPVYVVLVDVPRLMDAIEGRTVNGEVWTRNPKDNSVRYRVGKGEKMRTVDLRKVDPRAIVNTWPDTFKIRHVAPDEWLPLAVPPRETVDG